MLWVYPVKKEEDDREFSYEELMDMISRDELYRFDGYDIAQMFEFELITLKKPNYVAFIVFDVEARVVKKVVLRPVIEEELIKNLFTLEVKVVEEE